MSWVEEFVQKSKVVQSIILTGNVRDEFWDTNVQNYNLLPEYLYNTLKGESYKLVMYWEPNVLRFHNVQDATMYENLKERGQGENNNEEGEDYDLGDTPTFRQPSLTYQMSLNDFVIEFQSLVEKSHNAIAAIVNWGDYIIPSRNNPQVMPNDIDTLVSLSTYSLHTGLKPTINSMDLKNPTSTLVIITSNLSYIPHSLYQPDPRIKVISVNKPDLQVRRGYIRRHISDFNLNFNLGNQIRNVEEVIEDLASASDQLTLVDLRMMMEFANKYNEPVDPDKLVQLYKFGTKDSPWEQLDDEKLKTLRENLNDRVKGQETAIDHVVNTIIKASLGLSGLQYSASRSKPKGTLFFSGPTGVGKTELAKGIARFLFGDESAFIRFDMSEYKQDHSDQRLIGAPPGYVGFEAGGQLTNAVMERPFSVVLFDEIEKAHERILDIFLGILEDGRLTDGRGETAYFSETIIIFTSNLGASGEAKGELKERRSHYINAIEDHFVNKLGRPELLNRLGENIVVFNSIKDNEIKKTILSSKLKPLYEFIEEKFGAHLDIEENVMYEIVTSSDPKMGGRGILNIAESVLINPLSSFIFRHKKRLNKDVVIKVFMEEKTIDFKIDEVK